MKSKILYCRIYRISGSLLPLIPGTSDNTTGNHSSKERTMTLAIVALEPIRIDLAPIIKQEQSHHSSEKPNFLQP
jgi:hypothetical protein